jgi:myo-inositol catabolism protein IolC
VCAWASTLKLARAATRGRARGKGLYTDYSRMKWLSGGMWDEQRKLATIANDFDKYFYQAGFRSINISHGP